MALINLKTGKDTKRFYEYVVVGSDEPGQRLGSIRWIVFSRVHTSPILAVEYADKSERSRAVEVRVTPEFARKGWRLLRDMYADDPKKAHHWEDWVAFCEAQRDNPHGMKGKTFPAEYLPTAVVEMQKKARIAIADRTEFVFPSEKRAKVEAAAEKPDPAPAQRVKRGK